MQPFTCAVCGQLVFFDNSVCLRCGSMLGYEPTENRLRTLTAAEDGVGVVLVDAPEPTRHRRCANQLVAQCNWLVAFDDAHELCVSCRLTSVRPNDSETEAIAAFAHAETAKRRLIHQLNSLGLDVLDRSVDEQRGVAFEFLSSRNQHVITGHDAGVITLDLSESDDAHREFVRQQLGEPYRTVLGHLRHEIGHYYWPRLVVEGGVLDDFTALFGDPTIPYTEALGRHYWESGSGGSANQGWIDTHVSQYATVHPWEDWAETFAHYLHIHAGLETAQQFGLVIAEPALSAARDAYAADTGVSVGPMVQAWLGTTLVLNAMSRSIGQGDLYPFVLSTRVVDKLDFVHRLVTGRSGAPR